MVRIHFSGPRASGKTVLAQSIQKLLESVGVQSHREQKRDDDVLHIDNDFNPRHLTMRLIATPQFDTAFTMLIGRIRMWANDRNLIQGATSQAQVVKLFEEGGEVAAAVARSKRDDLKDGIGDMVVVLTILAAQNDLTLEECVAAAYDEIKDRKGRMVDGIFVREQ